MHMHAPCISARRVHAVCMLCAMCISAWHVHGLHVLRRHRPREGLRGVHRQQVLRRDAAPSVQEGKRMHTAAAPDMCSCSMRSKPEMQSGCSMCYVRLQALGVVLGSAASLYQMSDRMLEDICFAYAAGEPLSTPTQCGLWLCHCSPPLPPQGWLCWSRKPRTGGAVGSSESELYCSLPPMRLPATPDGPEAHLLAWGCPVGPGGEPLPRRCPRGAAVTLWCLRKNTPIFAAPGRSGPLPTDRCTARTCSGASLPTTSTPSAHSLTWSR